MVVPQARQATNDDGLSHRGRLTHGKSDDVIEDAMIAATARVHSLIVATRNVRCFKGWGVKAVNPFGYAA